MLTGVMHHDLRFLTVVLKPIHYFSVTRLKLDTSGNLESFREVTGTNCHQPGSYKYQ
jgi:hypothetical protein